jgi:hypothetical protein
MTEIDAVQSDLHFIRQAVQERRDNQMPLGIAIFWALACLAGFALVDFAPERTGLFWLVVAPVGFVFSAWTGWRDGRQRGEADEAEGHRIMWHWAGMMVAILLCSLMSASGELTGAGVGRAALLIVALSYFMGGLYFERSLIYIGILLAAGYVAVGFMHGYVWTALGVLVCIALLGAGLTSRLRRANG